MDIQTISGFSKFNFNKQLTDAIEKQGWTNPTPVQEKAIPLAKAGKDILGIAQTGTGKSAAFLIPLIAKLHYPQGENTRALVLAPTKELVTQLSLHFEHLNCFTGLRQTCLIGGLGITKQLDELKRGNDIVFATPGRFLEIYETGDWKLKDIKTLVIDEADRMMDMGFMHQIRKILEKIPSKRQNLLFSATFPEKVELLAEEFLEFPEKIEVTPQSTTASTISQSVYKTYNFQTKLNLLVHILKALEEEDAALVFVKTKKHATEIGKFLNRKLDKEVSFLHANKGTNTRSAAVESLQEGRIKILVTTDVAARGLDVARITLVINFDLPIQYEDYVHRIGRTGRALRTGKAISFVNAPDEMHLERIQKLIRLKIKEEKVPKFLVVTETPFEEQQEILKKLDDQRKKADPEFKGAFHDKKEIKPSKKGPLRKSIAKKPGTKKAFRPAGKPRK
jgi:ATP-dependent RNA helicase RhlE